MKKLLFVVDNLVMGGVTRVLSNMLNTLSEERYQIDLLVIHRQADMDVELPPHVRILEAGPAFSVVDSSIGALLRSRNIKKILSKVFLAFKIKTGLIKYTILNDRKRILDKTYDVEIAYGDGFPFFYVGYGRGKKKIAWMHYDVMVFDNSARYYSKMKKILAGFDNHVAVSKLVAQSNETHYGLKDIKVIHNIIDDKKICKQAEEECPLPFKADTVNLISVGRICGQKCFSRFVGAHKLLIENGFNVNSYIIGDGEEKALIENEIEKNGVSDSFFLLGRKNNPFPYVKGADVFVLSSDYEGLPTVLYEALILGVPCVSTAVAGADEILEPGIGIITPKSEEALFSGIRDMLSDGKYKEYKKNAAEYRFSVEEILGQIEGLLQ